VSKIAARAQTTEGREEHGGNNRTLEIKTGVNYWTISGLGIDPSTLALLQSSVFAGIFF
jgi:hypothetical protein